MTTLSPLFVPAHDAHKVHRALTSTADAVILDLEDSVPTDCKDTARAAAARLSISPPLPAPPIWVRINADASFDADVAAVHWATLAGAVLPKAECPKHLEALQQAGARELILLLESVTGLRTLETLVTGFRSATRVAIGTFDLAIDLGLWAVDDPDDSDLVWQLRGELVVQCRYLGLPPPIDGVYSRFDDLEGLRHRCRRACLLGFGGKLLIHPAQVAIAREAFSPSTGDLARAQRVIDAYEQALRSGHGVTHVDGNMIDRPVVERARQLLARAGEPR